jgi:hypothetical protein
MDLAAARLRSDIEELRGKLQLGLSGEYISVGVLCSGCSNTSHISRSLFLPMRLFLLLLQPRISLLASFAVPASQLCLGSLTVLYSVSK